MHKDTRLFTFLLILFLTQTIVWAQPNQEKIDGQNLYAQALFASITKMKDSWGKIANNSLNQAPTNYDKMIVEKWREITNHLPTKNGETQIEYLDWQGLVERSKRLKKEFSILVISPMTLEGSRLKISFTTHWITYKKHRLHYGLSDWSNVYFRYDCQQEKYLIDEVRLGGI